MHRLLIRVIALTLGAAVAACGGTDHSSATARTFVGAQTTSPATAEVLFTFNYSREDNITGWQAVRRVVTNFDTNRIAFQLLECGLYGSDPILGESGGYIWAPIGVLARVKSADLPGALLLGAIEGIPTGRYIRDSRPCGDISTALSTPRRVFAWASAIYPDHFPYFTEAVLTWEGFSYAYFAQTGNYIGVKDDRVYIHNGREWELLEVGAVTDFLPTIGVNPELN